MTVPALQSCIFLADENSIKKAYRRKALELHPDRNYGDHERATQLFAEVQVAYDVLSDPQERAWYDSHEGQILRGDAGGGEDHFEHNMRVTTADDITRMLRKFHGGIEYSDSPSGFFGFLRDTFETLAREEVAAAEWEGLDIVEYPTFGHKDDTYEDVVRTFYNMWNGFSTKKTFAWKDKYRYSDAEDRRMRRLMEKENKRLREDGIREFNEAVRTLVAFVRKRDPRYTPNTQTDEERSRAQRAAAAAQAARSKAAHAAKFQGDAVPEWAKARDPEEEEEEEEEEIEEEHFECVACHKTFKSEKQYDAHEKSKKHQKAVQALKRQMQKENRNLNLDTEPRNSEEETSVSIDQEEHEPDSVAATVASRGDGTAEEITSGVKKLKVSSEDDEDEVNPMNDGMESSLSKPTTLNESSDDEDENDDEYASRAEIEARLTGLDPKAESDMGIDQTVESSKTPGIDTPKVGKAAQKRAKRAAKQAEEHSSDSAHACVVCKATFPSKTKLFQHIKDLDHAALKSETGAAGGKKAGKKAGKGR